MEASVRYEEQVLRGFGQAILELLQGRNLTRQETKEFYRQILLSEQPELQQGAFLIAHLAKSPTTEEIAGAWEAQMDYDVETINPQLPEPSADIVGTGSDYLKTVNVSTGAAIIAAAAGAYVAKKGSRAATGVSGASDIFETLGVDLGAPLTLAERCLEAHRLCYIPGERFVKAGWGRLIKVMRFTTVFNVACPLLMPCLPTRHLVIGTYSAPLGRQVVEVCREIGLEGVLAVYGQSEAHAPEQGIDEISVCGPTQVIELRGDQIAEYTLTPADFGVSTYPYEAIATRDSIRDNTLALLEVLVGKAEGPVADLLCVNAASVLYLLGKAPTWPAGVDQSRQAVAQGKAVKILRHLVASQQRRPEVGLAELEGLLKQL
jgi:anthranilate phosphoribosyltransferase